MPERGSTKLTSVTVVYCGVGSASPNVVGAREGSSMCGSLLTSLPQVSRRAITEQLCLKRLVLKCLQHETIKRRVRVKHRPQVPEIIFIINVEALVTFLVHRKADNNDASPF